MADTPVQNFGPLPDTLTFGPFGPDGDIIVHIENLVLGCSPYVENIGVPDPCLLDEIVSITSNGTELQLSPHTTTGYYTVRDSSDNITTYSTEEGQYVGPDTYDIWPSDDSGINSGNFTDIQFTSDNGTATNDVVDLSGVPCVPAFEFHGLGLASIDTSLITKTEIFILSDMDVSDFDLSEMPYITGLYITHMPLTSLDITPLLDLQQCEIQFLNITSIDISQNTSFEGCNMVDNSLLSTVILSALPLCTSITFQGCALGQTSVDNILIAAAANGLAVSVHLEGGTNAAPSATGLAAKTTIEGNGGTVYIN